MSLLETLISTIAPHNCLVCGGEGSLVCAWCLPDMAQPLPDRCYRCLKVSPGSKVCASCRSVSRLRYVWVRTNYQDTPKDLVQALKFGRTQAAAAIIAKSIEEALPFLDPATVIVHIPTASSRVRLRGYDQAKLIAQALAKNLDRPYQPLLARLGQTRQLGAKRAERLKQLDGAFRPTNSKNIVGKHILLVDDVLTTGATIEAAAKVLKQAGAKSVSAVTFAQKQL